MKFHAQTTWGRQMAARAFAGEQVFIGIPGMETRP
jgi:hypothetical protein